MKDTFVEVITRDPLHSLDAGRRFMAVLENAAPDWLPGKWGHWEPLRREYDPADLEKVWSDELIWRGRGAKVEGMTFRPIGPHLRYGVVSIAADLAGSSWERAVHVAQDLGLAFDAVYGVVHLGIVQPWHKHGEEPSLSLNQFDLREGLRLYWGTLLGSPYVNLYGADRITSAPAYAVEQLGPELFWVQLTDRLEDVRTRSDDVAEAAVAVKEHLGDGVPEELATMTAPGETPRLPEQQERAGLD